MKTFLRVILRCLAVVVVLIVVIVIGLVCVYKYHTRTIDCVYSCKADFPDGYRMHVVKRLLPDSATNIQFYGTAEFGRFESRFSCFIGEREFIDFSVKNKYGIMTNDFTTLDYGSSEQEDYSEWRSSQVESDTERQFRLVFGGALPPKRFFSYTESHAFDGGAVGGNWRRIIVFDRDTGKLSGYVYETFL